MVSSSQIPTVALIGGSDKLVATCQRALTSIAKVVVSGPFALPAFGAPPVDHASTDNAAIIIITMGRVIQQGVDCIDALRGMPGSPQVFVFLTEKDRQATINIIEGLGGKALVLPMSASQFRTNIEHALAIGKNADPAPATLASRDLIDGPTKLNEQDRRHSFRAPTTSDYRATVDILLAGREWTVGVENLSIRSGSWLGGMLLRETSPLPDDVVDQLKPGNEVNCHIRLPNTATNIKATARIITALSTDPDAERALAIQYEVNQADDEDALHQYWIKLQRRSPA